MASDVDATPGLATLDNHDKNGETNEYATSQSKKFRFKSKKPSERHERSSSSRDRHHRHHHRTKRRKHSPSTTNDDPSLYDDTHLPNASSNQYLDPEVAFRESLFDAMADDEGAQFWEGVYGQPIHTYPDVKEGPKGELERMTDEEYTAFVRAKMYEKTHQHLLEEKAKRDAAKKERERLAKEGQKEEREAEKFRRKVEESLRRGEERKSRKIWSERWDGYMKKWEDLGKGDLMKVAIASIPWPVESGRRYVTPEPYFPVHDILLFTASRRAGIASSFGLLWCRTFADIDIQIIGKILH